MKKFIATVIITNLILWFGVLNIAKAETKEEAIVGHIITQTIQSNEMDHTEVMTNELNALMHKFSIEMTDVLLQYMPSILDSISAQLRLELDKKYKCSLQSDDYKNKDCS